ncbi:Heterogeneous nuclear ribonucleoprotein U-like protein 1 [Sesamum angolense]|uniref:Heterogeneous nuclear ribonucleoprotein U-like protein 1 n=1 Tax=Sesamum angolense TaxID=2727404 RepID=A0AAE2BII7_9LAMI|nr:Heterogeneous nuclear ribonucleoprotein U-like protein 1 [Sesamum angolense]
MASTKRELPFSDETQLKKPRVAELERFQSPAIANMRVLLNPADCDIDFNVGRDGLQGSALYEEGFAYCWSGARANIGVTRGKYCFGCKIVSAQPVVMEDTPVDQQHVCRVGISRGDDAVRNLGETVHSFGFGGTGKFSNSGNFFSYGETFGVGDTIVCCVDLEDRPMASIGFSKNGKWLGVAKYFDAGPSGLGVVGSPIKNLQWESALFPHVLLKNVAVQLQFSIDDGLIPEDGYKPWATAIFDGNTVLGPTFANENDCEVLMMVGLPASGKTTWAEKWVKEHPEKRYVLLGTNLALEQMKVPGLLRKHNYGERFDRLMDRATKIFNVLLSRASKIPRNFIIDQTNVYKSARKRKLKPFANYIKIAVVAFPTAEELKLRADKRFKEMGKEVPAEAVNQMLANYTLPMSKDMPRTDEYFDQVWFVELNGAESQISLDEMKREMSMKQSSRESSIMSYGYQSSYSSQPLSGAAYGSCYIGPSTYGSRLDFDNTGSFKGYDCSGISESQSRVLTSHGGSGEVYNSYRANDAYNHTGVGSQHFSHGVTVDPSLSNTVEPYSRALSYNTCNDRYASGSGGTLHDVPAMRHSAYQPATQVPYGSYGTQIPKPPFGSFPNDAQHAGAGGGYHQPSALRPPPMNFPADAQRPGLYPRPPWGY